MHSNKTSLFPVFLAFVFVIVMINSFQPTADQAKPLVRMAFSENRDWQPPDEITIPFDEEGEKVRYGKLLITQTAVMLGPKGIVGSLSNGMNCQNCHLYGGTQNFSNPFSAVASTYPRYRDRNARVESIEYRINECMKRSLNGHPLDSASYEMQAMVAYLKWIGKDVPKDVRPRGASTEQLPYLNRAADTIKGKQVFIDKCLRCHGADGQGLLSADSSEYVYPPLWGENSFNVSAGMYRISTMAGFIRNSMPFGISSKNPELTVEQAWDVAAYIISQPRPVKLFSYDWKDPSKKPIDYPFGPYADSFSTVQHKYGPFSEMKKRN